MLSQDIKTCPVYLVSAKIHIAYIAPQTSRHCDHIAIFVRLKYSPPKQLAQVSFLGIQYVNVRICSTQHFMRAGSAGFC